MNTALRTALRSTLLCLAGLLAASAGRAEGFDLITSVEAQQEATAEAEAPPRSRGLPAPPKENAPAIRVVSPAPSPSPPGSGAVVAPVRIELAFKPAPGARIVPSSFRVLYGLLKIDLTERLRKHATVTETGVVVEQAQVPAGQHRLILQVADDQGNTTEQELRIRVGSAS